jgi:molybdopterin-guanine dinucleotide biosynthesis protein A
MGHDKATLLFRGQPMVAIAAHTLRSVCAQVFLAGNRDDLSSYAPAVHESRPESGPAAGIEAALTHSSTDWVMVIPVDVPLMSAELLRIWAERVLSTPGIRASYLECAGDWHPALCLVRRECLPLFAGSLDAGDRKLTRIFGQLGAALLVLDTSQFMSGADECFRNVNTADELAEAERVAYSEGGGAAHG